MLTDAAAGQHELGAALCRLVAMMRPDLAELFESEPRLRHEPYAFHHFVRGGCGTELDAIAAAYGLLCGRSTRAVTRVSKSGYIYIPTLGYIQPQAPASLLEFVACALDSTAWVEKDGERQGARFLPSTFLPGTSIEVCRYDCPLLTDAFQDHGGGDAAGTVEQTAFARLDDLTSAFECLRRAWPALAAAYESVTRRIVLFSSNNLNSFSSPKLHGTIFLNAALGRGDIFLTEELAHQCGHVLFFAASQNPKAYISIDPMAPFDPVGAPNDYRTLYTALHGIVTEAIITVCLDRCLTLQPAAAKRRHEIFGRLGFIVERFGRDLLTMSRRRCLTVKGEYMVAIMKQILNDVIMRRSGISKMDFSNQAYNFDYNLFCLANGFRK